MSTRYFNFVLLLFFSTFGWAKTDNDSILPFYFTDTELDCDACGCAATSASNGIENLMASNFIGVRYFHQFYKAKENAFSNQLSQKQSFNTIQLWARIPIHKKIDVSVSLPYHFHEKNGQNKTSISGIGDLNVMGIVKIIQPKETTQSIKQSLSTAIGVKIPMAKFNQQNAETTNPSFQLGTGSWDTQFALNYQLTYSNSSVQFVTDYNLKGENKKQYKFGNQWNQLVQIQHLFVQKNIKLLGKIGFQNELYYANQQFNEKIPKSKGDAQFLKFGIEGVNNRFNYGIEYYQPIKSNLNSGEVEIKNRFGVFLNYNLSK